MAKFSLQIAKIVGTPSQQSGSWVHTFTPLQVDKLTKRGQLLAVIGLSTLKADLDVSSLGREVIARLHEEYYGDMTNDSFMQLRQAVERVITEANGEVEIELAAASVVGNILYVVVSPGGKLFISRQGKVVDIFRQSASREIASGYLQNNDLFVLGLPEFFRFIPQGVLQASLVTGLPEEMAETVAPIIHAQAQSQKAGALIVRFLVAEELLPAAETETGPSEATKESAEMKELEKINEPTKPGVFSKNISGFNVFHLPLTVRLLLPRYASEIKRFFQGITQGRAIPLINKISPPDRSRNTASTVALALLLILAVSIILGLRQKKSLSQTQLSSTLMEQAQAKLDEGEALISLNPSKARDLLLEAQQIADDIKKDKNLPASFPEFSKKLDEQLKKAIRDYPVEAKPFFDLTLIKTGAAGEAMISNDTQLYVLDKGQSSVYQVSLKDRKQQIVAGGGDLREASRLAYLTSVFLLTPEGLFQVSAKNPKLMVKTDEDWGQIKDMAGFGGSLYLLDTQGMIWKYPYLDGKLSSKQAWLKSKTDFLKSGISMAIDGSIWILGNQGEILKFDRGASSSFKVSGLPKPISKPLAIDTSPSTDNLYVLDQGNSRIVVFKKTGEYDSEYSWSGISQSTAFVVLEKDKKILLLQGNQIFQFDLQ